MPSNQWLLFVDTNIFLDFYRLGTGNVKRQLSAMQRHKAALILSHQVRMEFLKNRQKVVSAYIKDLKGPTNIHVPPILSDFSAAAEMLKALELAQEKYKAVREKIELVLSDPSNHDDVFAAVDGLFAHTGSFTLRADSPAYDETVGAARRRWEQGYPPRKDSDTSLGDAINWEWIVECASKADEGCGVCIVSRDADYGTTQSKNLVINDWLRREFKERAGAKRDIQLTNLLSVAFKLLDEPVEKEDADEEKTLVAAEQATAGTAISMAQTEDELWSRIAEVVTRLNLTDGSPRSPGKKRR